MGCISCINTTNVHFMSLKKFGNYIYCNSWLGESENTLKISGDYNKCMNTIMKYKIQQKFPHKWFEDVYIFMDDLNLQCKSIPHIQTYLFNCNQHISQKL